MPVCALRGIGYKTFAQLLGTGSTPTPGLYHWASPPHNCFPPLSRSRARRVKSRAESEFFCWPDCFPFRFTQCVVGSGDPSLTCKGCREVCAFMCSAFRPAGGACRSSGSDCRTEPGAEGRQVTVAGFRKCPRFNRAFRLKEHPPSRQKTCSRETRSQETGTAVKFVEIS